MVSSFSKSFSLTVRLLYDTEKLIPNFGNKQPVTAGDQ